MEANQYLNDFYNHYDEDSRLLFQHGSVEFLTTMRYIEKYLKHGDKVLAEYVRDGLLDARTFAASSQPKDLFELVRKEDVDELMSVFPVTRLHYVASDGCALLLRDEIDAMDADAFALYLKYHFATCERADLAGITSHAVDIFRK